ncbi:sensor histidine kinase KdpD, partial [bacterium]|nr:sensor histidine kinase KdpD [bacterium]
DNLLKEINRMEHGKLTVFLGPAAGVGKTCAMLIAAKESMAEGKNVLIGWIDTHGRKETEPFVAGIPRIEPVKLSYRGREFPEMDLNNLLKSKPEIAIVDELAHTNIPGSLNTKRYQDVEELLKAGVDVYTTLNIQHIESLNDVIAKITGVSVTETVPDKLLEEAEIRLVDIDADALIQRLKEGKIYIPFQAAEAIKKFFRPGNINALREISLRYTANNVDEHLENYMQSHGIRGPWQAGEKVLVCINKNSFATHLIRMGKRMANSLNAEFIVANVDTPWEPGLSASEQSTHANNLKLAESLGAEIISLTGTNIADEIISFSKKRNITQLIIGKSLKPRPIEWFQESVVDKILRNSDEIRVHVVPTHLKRIRKKHLIRKKYANYILPYLVGFGLLFLFFILCKYFENSLGIFNITLLFSIPMVLVAFFWGYLASIIISIAGFLVVDFFFIDPRYLFTIADLRYIPSFFIYLALVILISYLSKNIRTQIKFIKRKEEHLAILYSLSRKISAKINLDEIIENVKEKIEQLINCKVIFLIKDDNNVLEIHEHGLDPETNKKMLEGKEKAVAQWVLINGQIAGKGTDFLDSSKGIYFPLKTQDENVGVLGIFLNEKELVLTIEQKKIIEAICGLLAAVIYRIKTSKKLSDSKVLEQSQKLYSAVFNSISHDLRTPLTSIIGSSSSLENDEKILNKQDRRELIQNISQSSLRMLRIINNLLDMARIESEQLTLNYEWCDMEDIIGVAIKEIENIGERNLGIRVKDNLPLIWADFSLIEQVFINLLDNSVKYSQPGSNITIEVLRDIDNIIVNIADNGIGVPHEEIPKIFDKFHRVKVLGSIQGTGLGLSICKSIIELHKGTISAKPNEGKGLIITFTLPIYSQPELTKNKEVTK